MPSSSWAKVSVFFERNQAVASDVCQSNVCHQPAPSAWACRPPVNSQHAKAPLIETSGLSEAKRRVVAAANAAHARKCRREFARFATLVCKTRCCIENYHSRPSVVLSLFARPLCKFKNLNDAPGETMRGVATARCAVRAALIPARSVLQ